MKKLTFISYLITLFGCSDTKVQSVSRTSTTFSSAKIHPLIIENDESEGWGADIRLSIIEETQDDSVKYFKALSTYQDHEVGLLIGIPKKMKLQNGFGKGIIFKSIGTSSDHLLELLYKLYKQKTDIPLKFKPLNNLTFINLQAFASSITGKENDYSASNEYKLFFESKNGDAYAELYLNINTDENWIEIKEKDDEYRSEILKFLSK